jgi:thiosulfate/3-mercaptopyruvate sulfurtransferase
MRIFIIAASLALATPALSQPPRDKLVISTAGLASRLAEPNLVILQVGDRAGFEAGHIPGAQLLTLTDIAAPMGGEALTLEMPEPEALRARLTSLGVSDKSRIVVVPTREGVQSATRVVFTLDAAGLGARTVLLDGGAAAWSSEGRPLTKVVATPTPGRMRPLRYRPLVVDAGFVRAHANAPGYRIVDARAPEFYTGARPGGPPTRPHKRGHIKGAVSVPFTNVAGPDLRLASAAEIAARFKAAGVKPGDTVIAYCHVGQQATAIVFAARTLNLDVRLYDGSFEEWSRLDGEMEPQP